MPVSEAGDAAVLEETADDAFHMDVLGEAAHAGTEAANAANDQLDFDAGMRGAIEMIDHRRVDQRVELRPDMRRAAGAGMADLVIDQLPELLPEGQRRDSDLLERRRRRITG